MSRRESLVGGEVVAEDAAEQAEKKRKQDEQRAHARTRNRACEIARNFRVAQTGHFIRRQTLSGSVWRRVQSDTWSTAK